MALDGYCLCGACRYEIDDDAVDWQALCVCESCRRASGAPVVGWMGVARDGFRWTGDEPGRFASSPGVMRSFCPTCGTPLTFSTDKREHQIDVLAATLSDPAVFRPERVDFADEALDWHGLHISLPPSS
ncbi:GFA family protein [Wenxinia marina]|uniref:CENP-V/GFA domain-containing protein n=1 Tax=Wenxinia marina DSM 24838 TaxID=1123501 RepID=A0A0D0Q3G6_9RHOB|nr:GFA family protein [Wenxinia marina]KIQ69079.1 hypothetical protein Wenmar_02147 [Wenxinia marina DSM 24838]GGL70145.1 hypothetical protein GCM10011392_25890 [Wenxinia marina]